MGGVWRVVPVCVSRVVLRAVSVWRFSRVCCVGGGNAEGAEDLSIFRPCGYVA